MELANDLDVGALQRVLAGQPSALLELYDRHAPRIFAHAYASLGDRTAAEDVVQETFTAAWFEVRNWASAPRDAMEWLLDIARERLAARAVENPAPDEPFSAAAVALPRALRERVLDSIYGAGERLRPPYSTPQWARRFSAKWIVWLLALGEGLLILALS
jgi:RNA polymerase sigma-70 factor (ECF subfamily)